MSFDNIPQGARAFLSFDPHVGLGGLALPKSLRERWGMPDAELRRRLALFRAEPAVPLGLPYWRGPGVMGFLHLLFNDFENGDLHGGPSRLSANLAGLRRWQQLAPLLPHYRLPACDAVSVRDVVQLLNRLDRGDIPGALSAPPGPSLPRVRPAALMFRQRRPSGPVTSDHVDSFAHWCPGLQADLMGAIPWRRAGWTATAAPGVANAIASEIIGIPVDLRAGALIRWREVRDAIDLAAGMSFEPGEANPRPRVWDFVHEALPRVGSRARTVRGALRRVHRGMGKAAWSEDVDAVLNSPALWARVDGALLLSGWRKGLSGPLPLPPASTIGDPRAALHMMLQDADAGSLARA
jgi:hypothetical protein